MPSPKDDKQSFALRLKQALKRSKKKVETPTQLALEFNLRYKAEPISNQTAQKWLAGHTRPTPDKIETLAEWLKVSPQWLRYGISEKMPPQTARPLSKKAATNRDAFSDDEVELILRMRSLSEHQRYLIAETVEQFALNLEMWHE